MANVIAIFGATSDIAAAVARKQAEAGHRLILIGRNTESMAADAADYTIRGAETFVLVAEFTALSTLHGVVEAAYARWNRIDVALIAYGTLPDQAETQGDWAAAQAGITANFTSQAILANALARLMERQGSGTIAVITSVAGLRGRASNHLYGSAKGGLQRFLQGLRHRMYASGVKVVDIRPGFVSTKMNVHLAQHGPLWATPETVATDIIRAIKAGRPVIYTPWFWRPIMAVVRLLPRAIFHRTRL